MSLFDKIKDLLSSFQPVKIQGPVTIAFLSGNKFIDFRPEKKEQKIVIDLSRAESQAQIDKVKEIAKDLREDGQLFLESEPKKTLEDIESSVEQHRQVLSFFKGRLLPEDYKILKLAAYLKSRFDRRLPIDELLQQVYARYGQRGKNICNLYSSGYFENSFIPFYEKMQQSSNFSFTNFQSSFDMLVTDCPFATFVSKRTTKAELAAEIRMKLEKNRRYGITELNIHGISLENIEKIRSVLPVFESDPLLKISHDESNGFIRVHIEILPDSV